MEFEKTFGIRKNFVENLSKAFQVGFEKPFKAPFEKSLNPGLGILFSHTICL